MKRNEYPSKEEVEQFYIKELHTVQECADHFGFSKGKVYSCLKYYGIQRTHDDKIAVYTRAQNNQEVKDKIRQINMDKYGFSNKAQFNSPIRFIDENNFSVNGIKYTVEWLRQRYITDNISSQQMEEELNVSYTLLNKICQHYGIRKDAADRYELIKNSNINKYGVVSTLQLEETREKSRATCIQKYGVDNCFKNKEIQDKIHQTNMKKYGVENERQSHILNFDIWSKDETFISYINSFQDDNLPTVYELCDFFNLTKKAILTRIHDLHLEQKVFFHPRRSHYEDDIKDFLQNELGVNNIVLNDWSVLEDLEIDIYLPDYHMGIEFNGSYWHSDIWPRYQDHNGRSKTHQNKSLTAEANNVFLFHIFEYEWINPVEQENIKNRLKTLLMKNNIKIPARKCEIVELTKNQKKEFLNTNHIQGNDHSTIQYGLLYKNEIVACMTFVHPKNDKYTWELSRFCNKHGCTVQGGASKLFKHFAQTLSIGDTVSSYNDITKTKGDLYKILGFECISINQPNYVWINFQTDDIKTRYQEQKGGEVERMHSQNYHRVCDCGTKTWVYTVK